MMPLTLILEPLEVTAEGKKKKVHVLNLRVDTKLADLAVKKLPEPEKVDLPDAEDEVPELIIPENQEPKTPLEMGITSIDEFESKAVVSTQSPEPEIKNLGELFGQCFKVYKLTPSKVIKELGLTDKTEIGDVNEAWQQIRAARE